MSFIPINWFNQAADGTIATDAPAISAENLNRIENGLFDVANEVEKFKINSNNNYLQIEFQNYTGSGEENRTITFENISPYIILLRSKSDHYPNISTWIKGQTDGSIRVGANTHDYVTLVWGNSYIQICQEEDSLKYFNNKNEEYLCVGIGIAK